MATVNRMASVSLGTGGAKYAIDRHAQLPDLASDLHHLVSAALALVRDRDEEDFSAADWALVHLLALAEGLAEEVHTRADLAASVNVSRSAEATCAERAGQTSRPGVQ